MFKLAIYLQSIALILVSAESFTSDEIGDIICQNSNNGSYFMDPNNCTGYYICVNHSGYHEFCSEGLYWNQAIQSCDLRETVNCTTICDGQTDNDHLSDPNNCAGFYECLNNTGIHHFCPADLYWNQAIRSCDFPENVNCTADMTTTTPSPNTTKAPSNDVCEGQANGTHLADPKSCSGYYICSNNKGIHETCPDSLYWNQAIRSCDFRENVNCTDITTTTPSVTTSNPNRDICDGISDGTYVADPKSCSGYYACSNNKGSHLTCPGDLYWNQPIQSCDLRENVNCTDITTSPSPATTRIPSGDICDGQANDTYLADPNSCSGYYRCINNVGVHDTCPDGLYWHQAIKSCDFQEHVNCTDGITTTTTSPSPATTTSPNEDICHGKADGTYLEDPKNCAGYYHCSNNQGIHEYCLDGLYWNQIILSCDFPSHVNCSTVVRRTPMTFDQAIY